VTRRLGTRSRRLCHGELVNSRALRFGSVASAYERFRPGYPDRLVDDVLAYADRPVRTALEIGAGTGKATRAFAARGIAVTATDPDPAMLAELRICVPQAVVTVEASLEQLSLAQAYDLFFAASALHWTDPVGRWPRIATLITPGGVFASFGSQLRLDDPAVSQAVGDVLAGYGLDDNVPSPDGTPPDSPVQWPGTELLAAREFTDLRQRTLKRRLSMSASDYVGHLSTVSAYLALSEDLRAEVLDRIAAALPQRVSVNADLVLHLARRSGRT
jgi:SAM-dependent methyltransferase